MSQKIGIMGGTFNPIHFGHLILAETAYYDFNLDKVLIMPTKEPAYRTISGNVDNDQRIDMINLAIENNPHFEISLLEIEREGNTYTVDTLRQLLDENYQNEYYFIMGADSLYHFESWKEPNEILKLATILVATRDNVSDSALDSQIDYLCEKYSNADIRPLKAPNMEISSHNIRKRIRNNKSIKYLLNDKVVEYIMHNGLYINKG